MNPGIPVLKDLVLVGGGHSHVAVIKSFGMEPMPGVRLTVVSRDAHAPYSGMLPGLIAGHYGFDDAHIDLRPLARFAGARFLHDEVVGLDLQGRSLLFRERPPLPFDVLSINIGATPGLDVPGARGTVVPVKPIAGFWSRWELLRDRCLRRRETTRISVVGAGAGGVELLLSVQHRLTDLLAAQNRGAGHLRFELLSATDEILPSHNHRVREKFVRVLAERGVEVHTGRAVAEVAGQGPFRLTLDDGGEHEADEVLWVTTARAAAWPASSGLQVGAGGFIQVRDTLQTLSDAAVFAAGDIADVVDHPRPKAGVFAVRQGPPLAANLRARLLGEPAEPFYPQARFLSLISTGDRYAVASRGEWAAEGAWVWRWKDHIDRRFMERYNDLPEMDPDADPDDELDPRLVDDDAAAELVGAAGLDAARLPTGLSERERAVDLIATPPMRCGGCGAKVGATLLSRVLAGLRPVTRPDVVRGLDAPDDAAVLEVPAGSQLVQTTDFFPAFIDDPYLFGRITVHHALGDVYAMGAEPQAALATVVVPPGLESKMEAELLQLLAGAVDVLNGEQTALVGGHTSEGAVLALGFTVNGLVAAGAAIGKDGLQPGDALVVTKPLGTGALLAADMRGKAKGRWVAGALASMDRSNRGAAACLIEHGVTAMTDVTGFGLLGHLVEMAKASRVGVELDLDALPALDGVFEVMEAGVFSSLQPANLRLRRAVANVGEVASSPAYRLLFDPQTAGGLLAGVPADNVGACVNELRRRGYGRATMIGRVRERDGDAAVVLLAGSSPADS